MKRFVAISIILFALVAPCRMEASRSDYITAYNYSIRFYPRWLSWMQFQNPNKIVAPSSMGPEFKVVVAINDDTIYTSLSLELLEGPQILTIPAYPNIYSILQLDCFGDIFQTDLKPSASGGVYGLIGPKYEGELPAGVTPIRLPYNMSLMFIRADKYSPQGVNQIQAAEDFRANLQLQSLADYQKDPTGGKTVLLPLYFFSTPIKQMADDAMNSAPQGFLKTLQEAMASPNTEPLTSSDKSLIRRFNNRFKYAQKAATKGHGEALLDITNGARDAHAELIDYWLSNTDENNWIHFNDIGVWGKNYLSRAALTEYIQYGNNLEAAYYAHAFLDGDDIPLDGSMYSYVIHFTPDQIPQMTRFWSITAYTPLDIELVDNTSNKYVVASYTPGLIYDSDGGVTVIVQANAPKAALIPNWLPVPNGPFNLMLRIYGPEDTAADGTYVPPKITRLPYNGNE